MRWTVLPIVTIASLTQVPTIALADAPTHRFQLKSAKTVMADCSVSAGRKQCSPYCVMHASIVSLASLPSPPFTIEMKLTDPLHRNEDGIFNLVFPVEHLEGGQSSEISADVPGIGCKRISIESVLIESERTAPFINVEFTADQRIGLARQRQSN